MTDGRWVCFLTDSEPQPAQVVTPRLPPEGCRSISTIYSSSILNVHPCLGNINLKVEFYILICSFCLPFKNTTSKHLLNSSVENTEHDAILLCLHLQASQSVQCTSASPEDMGKASWRGQSLVDHFQRQGEMNGEAKKKIMIFTDISRRIFFTSYQIWFLITYKVYMQTNCLTRKYFMFKDTFFCQFT